MNNVFILFQILLVSQWHPATEKRVAEKVSEVRKRKNRRLKQAREKAQTKIEKY